MSHPFNKKFPSGYVLQVDSWENDGDQSLQEMLYGLTLEEVKFYVAFLPYLESCHSDVKGMGNEEYSSYQTFSVIMDLYPKHKEVISSLFPGYNFKHMYSEHKKEEVELDKPIYGQLIDQMYELITSLVSDPVEYEGQFVRVYNGHKVFFLKEEIIIPALKEVRIK